MAKNDTRFDEWLDDMRETLRHLPAWAGPVLAAVAFAIVRYLIPAFLPEAQHGVDTGKMLRPILHMFSWIALAAILMAWIAAEIDKRRSRRLLDGQSGLETIRGISWQDFEQLVAEAFRRRGYIAEVVGTSYGDGGVDIQLTRAGEKVLVQCKQWKAYQVGVTTVRELLGVMTSQRATGGIVVTSGKFTREARTFAVANPSIELVDGPLLEALIREVQTVPLERSSVAAPPANQPPLCPECGSLMKLRTAKKGSNAGSQFWGCSRYPGCRGVRQLRLNS